MTFSKENERKNEEIEDLHNQISHRDRLLVEKDMVIYPLNYDLDEAYEQLTTQSNEDANKPESNSLKLKCNECSFEGKTMKGLKTHMKRKHING